MNNNSTSSLDSSFHFSKINIPRRRFSANKMLLKAKVALEKRHSLESKRSNEENQATLPLNDTAVISNRDSYSSSFSNENENHHHTLKAIKKRLSIGRRSNLKSKSQESISSMTDATTSSASSLNADNQPENKNINSSVAAVAAAAAEADILSGLERPGSFALACDFHLANNKHNEEFHTLFKSVPDSDMLIEYYKCALQKDILLQGHLYVSEHHVCFKSNIFGWVTNLVINFSEIVRVEKRMTAKIIPNGILIATNTSKHIFASFLLRDQAYDQIVKIWDLSKRASYAQHPGSTRGSFDETDEDDEEDSIDLDIAPNSPPVLITDHHDPIITQSENNTSKTTIPSNNNEISSNEISSTNNALVSPKTKQRPRSISESVPKTNILSLEPILSSIISKPDGTGYNSDTMTASVLKNSRACPCAAKGEQHHHIVLNETYNGTVDAMAKLLFNSSFSKSFLEKYETFEDVELSAWKHGARQVTGKRRIKSSTSGIRLINILFQDKREYRKSPYYCCISTKKSMPDMPMGAVYSIQSRTCITRASSGKVHVLISFQVVFSKSGLVSSIIEKNAADDQFRMYKRLNSILKKPELLRTLIGDNKQLLQELKIIKSDPNTSNPKLWRISLSLTDCIYIGFFFVLATHCILAIRLQRITHHLEWVQQQAQPIHHDHQWVNDKINLAHQRLDHLKSEVKGYDERIAKLRDQQSNLKM